MELSCNHDYICATRRLLEGREMHLWTLALLVMPLGAHASGAGACYSIQDADARSYCIARAKKEASHCYSIQNADMRSMCLAEVYKK